MGFYKYHCTNVQIISDLIKMCLLAKMSWCVWILVVSFFNDSYLTIIKENMDNFNGNFQDKMLVNMVSFSFLIIFIVKKTISIVAKQHFSKYGTLL